jgi:methyl-accepting chemotaxis protein
MVKGFDGVSQTAKGAAMGADEVNQTSQDLARRAENLSRLVKQFKI